jgi:hypothetical protein
VSQLPDLFPVEGIFDPKPVQSDLPDIFPPGMDPATTGAMARQAAGMQAPQAVQDIHMSRKAGQDPGFVARNRDDIKLQLEVAGLEENLVGSPGVRAFIHKSPHHLAASKDDIQGLADLERFLQKSGNTAMTIPKTLLKVGPQLAVTTNQALAMVAGQIDTAAQGLADMTGMEAGGLFGDIQQWLYDQNKPVEEYMEEYLSPSEEVQKPLWGNWELLADPEYLMTQTGDALVSFVPMVLGAAATGGSSVVTGVIGGFQEAASMYQDLIEEGVDPAQAGFWTPIFGTIVGKLNQIGFDKIMSANVAKSFLSRLYNRGVAGTTEALTEYAEEPAQAFLSSIARGDDVETTLGNTLDSLKNVDVMVGAFFMGGGLHGSQLRRDVALARAKEQELDILDALTQNMEQSNLAKMDPQLYQEAVATLKEGGQIQEIFIPASAIATNTGSTNPGADMAVLTGTLNQLGVSMDAYQAALSAGQVVAVPVENYAAAVASDPAFAAQYAGDRKLSEDGLTRNERVQAEVEFQTEMANAVQMFKEDHEATTAHEAEMQTIRDEVLSMRQATGLVKDTARQDAGTVAASFGAMARLTKGQFTPMQLWQKYGPQIQRGVEQEALAAQSLHQVPPDVARSLNYETKLPTDPIFGEAIANTPGAELLADGVELDLTRYQKEEQTGDTSVRTGVFYLPTGSAQEKHYRGGKNNYGGTVKVQGRTLLRAPLFVKGATGGKAPEAAYDSIFGKKAYSKMREDVLSAVSGWGLKEQAKVANIRALLDKYEANTVDAYEIYINSREGNTLAYAIQENIVAHAVRRAGYDSVVGYSKKKDGGAFISEVFDVREMTNPDRTGYTDISDTFYQSLSTRLPSAVKSVEDPLNEVLTLDFNVALSDVKTLEKNMQALLATPNMRKPKGKGAKTPAKQAEMFIDHVVSNLLFLHDAMDPDMRSRAKLWYDGGRKTIETWAERYGISEMQGASLIAVLSPQNGWFPNVSQAERIADIVFGMRDFRWDAAMSATAAEILKKDTSPDIMAAAEGKTLEEVLGIPNVAARWIRVYDQTHNSRAYRVLTPEGGAADFAKTNSGADATNAWKSYGTIAKGVSILLDGRAENVYYQIGQEHKVRNFYNNLFDPASPLGFTTIDTHAVAAAMLRPLAAADTEVLQAFGGTGSASSNVTGMNGTYPLYLEAYKRAAAARGLLPREMQSITWEAVRGLFEASKKKSLKQAANDIWLRYKDGEIEQEQAQQEIFELASGVTPPSWSTVPFTDEVQRTYEGPAQAAIDARDPAGKTESDGFRVFFEVAPDPNDVALTAEWDALPQDVKQAVSQQVAQAVVPKVLAEIGVSGSMDLQLGGYMGATNPSMALVLDRPELLISAAKLLGFSLSQDSMMVVSDRQSVGTQPVGAVTIDLPEGYGAKEVEALYDKLWELEQDGEKLVGGHTTANGHMVILNFSGIDTKALADIVDKHLGGAFVVADDEVFSAFIDKEAYQYDTNQQPTAARRTSVQGRANNLRNEATRLLRESLDAQGVRTLHQLAPVRGRGPQVFGGVDSQAVRAAYGSAVEGAESVTGIHYSREPRESLSGHFYGSGIKGAEARRLDLSSDVRLKKRIHFYVDTGSGIRPEPGVGANIHAVNLQNIYNVLDDPLGIVAAAYADRMKDPAQAANDMESAILDAGFDGYWNPEAQSTKGVAVLLGDQHTDVPVELVQGPTLAQNELGFYSAVENAISGMDFKTMPGGDLANRIKKTAGIKTEELEDLGLIDWLEGAGKVSKDQVLEFVRQGGPQIEEVTKGEGDSWVVYDGEENQYFDSRAKAESYAKEMDIEIDDDSLFLDEGTGSDGTKYSRYQLPGGENYREVLLTLPDASNGESARKNAIEAELKNMELTPETMQRREELRAEYRDLSDAILARGSYQSAHWDEPNVLAHVRLNDRTGTNGEKILFIEEIQSDWHQEGRRKGYDVKTKVDALVEKYPLLPKDTASWTGPMIAEAGVSVDDTAWIVDNINALNDMGSLVPSAPFKKSWAMLAFKRVLRMAAEQGYDSVAWAPGEVQAERYDLSKQISKVTYSQNSGGRMAPEAWRDGEPGWLMAADPSGRRVVDKLVEQKDLPDYVGKEVADRLLAQPYANHNDGSGLGAIAKTLSGLDLKVGGTGMIGFYDKILPAEVGKYVKKWGVKIGEADVKTSEGAFKGMDSDGYDIRGDTKSQQVWIVPLTDQMRQDIMQGQPLYQDQQQPKASFTFKTKSGRPLIELFEKADQSSFIHETGHLYLEMIRDMALQQDAPAAIAALWSQAKDALKIDDGQIPVAAHEQWARNLEAYFAKGEAPALGLRGLFTKYSEWLRAVYREIENIFAGSGTEFNPALTPIFDRLFATERDMMEVEAFYAAQRPFFDAADGVAAADQERLDKLRNKAIEDSHAAHLRRLTEAYIKSQGGRKALADELRSEVESRPVYLAIEAARNGGFELGDIDHLVGEETRKAISKKWKIVKVGGDLDANVVAAQHGYDSAAAMLQEMATAVTKQAALKVEVDARVEQERQKILQGLLDADTDVAADEAYHNDSRLALLVAEFALLAEKQSKQQGAMARALDAAAAREVAKQTLLGMPMKSAIDYKKFARAERKAAMQARDAKKAGKTKEALAAKRLELLNHALFMESMKLRGQVEKLGKAIKKGAKQKSLLPGAKDLLRTLGVQYGLMPYRKLKKGEAWAAYNQDMVGQDRATLAEWAAEREDEYGAYFDEFVLQNSAYVDIQNLTVDQFDQIRQAVNVIRTVDRHERTVLINGERLAMEEAEARLALSLEGRKLNSGQRSKRKSRFRKTFAHLHAFHAKMEALLLDLDGWEHGHWWNMFFRPIAEAENARSERMKIVGTKIHSLFDPIKKGMGKSIFIPEIQDSLQKSEILAIALNMGNEGNTLRLREGFPEWDLDALFQRMTQTEELLTAKDWKFVQSIWDYMDTFRDESFKLQKDLTGREPERVMPTPLATMHGVLAGGYYPAVYDTDLSFTAFSRDQKSLDESLFGGRNYGAAQTKHNHLKERAKTGASQAVSLELSVITDHLYNTVHDLTHRKAVVQVAKLMKRPAVRKMVEDALSPEAYREFMPWLQDVARERQDPTNQIIRLSRWARKGATIMNMGLKVTTMVTQPLGILQTVDLLGAEYTAVGLKHVYGNSLKIHKVYDQITEKSAFMANRIKSFDRDVRESMKGLTTVDTLRRQVDEFAFKGIGYMQLGVDLPTWWGAYQRGLSENLGDEAKAVAYADSIVRLSQSSGSMKDLARIQRGGELQRQFTMFYSYFSAFYQLAYRRVSKTKSVSDIPTAAASALMLWFLPAILSELVAGRGPDDDEEWWEWAMGNLLVYPFLTIGYVKEIASAIESGYDYQLSPSAGAPASLVKWARSVGKAIEEEEPERAVKPTIEAVGYALQLPLKQPVITLGNIWDYITGEDPEFEVRDLFYSKPKSRR